MSKDLKLTETIEKYLNEKLSEADKIAFEKEINSNPSIKELVELQKQVQAGVERVGLKQQTGKSFKKYNLVRNLRNWGLGITIAVATSAIIYFSYKGKTNPEPKPIGTLQPLAALNENGEKLWSDADKYLPAQYFELDPTKDTVIETEKGIVFSIPANCFLDADGRPAHSPIQFEVKEAMDANSIIQAGLSSKSGDKPLESAGMFYLNARSGDESLKIDPKNNIYAEIPTSKKKPGMMLFEGNRLPNGTIDWVSPKPLENYLVPVDIKTLDFYPSKYLDSLAGMGKDVKNKEYTDSLYYSFSFRSEKSDSVPQPSPTARATLIAQSISDTSKAMLSAITEALKRSSEYQYTEEARMKAPKIFRQNCAVCHRLDDQRLTGPGLAGVADRVPQPVDKWLFNYIKNNDRVKKSGDKYAQKLSNIGGGIMTIFDGVISDEDLKALVNYIKYPHEVGLNSNPVNPSKVKAIWNEKFNNTLIATKEFEERLMYMHGSCNGNALDLYINNIEKNMCTIDSMAAVETGDDWFYEFAGRANGKVKAERRQLEKLKFYYESKNKAYAQAVEQTKQKFLNEQAKLDMKAESMQMKQNNRNFKEWELNSKNFQQELKLNLKEAYRQLGKPVEFPPARASYGVSIDVAGWKNVDAYVLESTANRKTLDYTDKDVKKAVIKYKPISVQINQFDQYDRVVAYLLPNKLDGFMRMNEVGGRFTESLNELIHYKLVCVGYMGTEVFLYTNKMANLRDYNIDLIKVDGQTLKSELNDLYDKEKTGFIIDDVLFQQFDFKEKIRRTKLYDMSVLRSRIERVIFPCHVERESSEDVYSGWSMK